MRIRISLINIVCTIHLLTAQIPSNIPSLLDPDHNFGLSEKEQLMAEEVARILQSYELNGLIYSEDIVVNYIQAVMNKLKPEAMSSIPTQILILKESVFMTTMFPTGTLAINLGVLGQLRSENDLAFILAHELSHLILRHSLKLVTEGEQLEKKKDRGYRSSKRWAKFSARYSREAVLEADSLAVWLMARSGYPYEVAIDALDLFPDTDTIYKNLSKWSKISLGYKERKNYAFHPPKQDRIENLARITKKINESAGPLDADMFVPTMQPAFRAYVEELSLTNSSYMLITEYDRLLQAEHIVDESLRDLIQLKRAKCVLDMTLNPQEAAWDLQNVAFYQGTTRHKPSVNPYLQFKINTKYYEEWHLMEKKETIKILEDMFAQNREKAEVSKLLALFAWHDNRPAYFKEYVNTYLSLQPDAKDAFYYEYLIKNSK
jgi:hypothetical protein